MFQPSVPVLSDVVVIFAAQSYWLQMTIFALCHFCIQLVSRPEAELPRTSLCSSYNTNPASQNRVSECALRIELYIHTYIHTYVHTQTRARGRADYNCGTTSLAGCALFPKLTSGLHARMIHSCHQTPSYRWQKTNVCPDAFSNSTHWCLFIIIWKRKTELTGCDTPVSYYRDLQIDFVSDIWYSDNLFCILKPSTQILSSTTQK